MPNIVDDWNLIPPWGGPDQQAQPGPIQLTVDGPFSEVETFGPAVVGSAYGTTAGLSKAGASGTGFWTYDSPSLVYAGEPSTLLNITAASVWYREIRPLSGLSNALWITGTFTISQWPGGTMSFLEMRQVTGSLIRCQAVLNTSGQVLLRDNVTARYTSTTALQLGVPYTVAVQADRAAAKIRLRLYDRFGTLLEDSGLQTYTSQPGPIDSFRFGAASTPSSPMVMRWQHVGYHTATWMPAPPVLPKPLDTGPWVFAPPMPDAPGSWPEQVPDVTGPADLPVGTPLTAAAASPGVLPALALAGSSSYDVVATATAPALLPLGSLAGAGVAGLTAQGSAPAVLPTVTPPASAGAGLSGTATAPAVLPYVTAAGSSVAGLGGIAGSPGLVPVLGIAGSSSMGVVATSTAPAVLPPRTTPATSTYGVTSQASAPGVLVELTPPGSGAAGVGASSTAPALRPVLALAGTSTYGTVATAAAPALLPTVGKPGTSTYALVAYGSAGLLLQVMPAAVAVQGQGARIHASEAPPGWEFTEAPPAWHFAEAPPGWEFTES